MNVLLECFREVRNDRLIFFLNKTSVDLLIDRANASSCLLFFISLQCVLMSEKFGFRDDKINERTNEAKCFYRWFIIIGDRQSLTKKSYSNKTWDVVKKTEKASDWLILNRRIQLNTELFGQWFYLNDNLSYIFRKYGSYIDSFFQMNEGVSDVSIICHLADRTVLSLLLTAMSWSKEDRTNKGGPDGLFFDEFTEDKKDQLRLSIVSFVFAWLYDLSWKTHRRINKITAVILIENLSSQIRRDTNFIFE